MAALRRVGRALGAAEGTGPDDDPQLRAERLHSHAEGHAEGRAKGRVEGRIEMQRAAVLQVFHARGMPVSAAFPRRFEALQGVSVAVLVQASLQCRDEADFLRLIRGHQYGNSESARRHC